MKTKGKVLQKTFNFSLIYADAADLPEGFDDVLFEAGFDDSLVMTRDGLLILDCDREAVSFKDALLSAIDGVERSGLPVRLVRVEPLEPPVTRPGETPPKQSRRSSAT